jgi:hypothetical protein
MRSSVLSLLTLQAVTAHATTPVTKAKLRAPEIELSVTINAETVSVSVTNKDAIPLTLVADAHLLALDITQPKASDPKKARPHRLKTMRCTLPLGIRPPGDTERRLEIPPGGSYKESIDLRLLCFSQAEHEALEGSTVTARLGFPNRVGAKTKNTRTKGPAIVRDPSEATAYPIAELVASPVSFSSQAEAKGAPSDAPLKLQLGKTVDVATSFEAPLSVSIQNVSKRSQRVRIKPEALRLSVMTPDGRLVTCDLVPPTTNPIREFYSTLRPKGKVSLLATLSSVCPHETFQRQGLYRLIGSYNTSAWANENDHARAFTGKLDDPSGTWIRIRQGKRPMQRPAPTLAAPNK